jgi:hypothetical protein
LPCRQSIPKRLKSVKPDIFGRKPGNTNSTLISIGFHRFSWVCERYNPELTLSATELTLTVIELTLSVTELTLSFIKMTLTRQEMPGLKG